MIKNIVHALKEYFPHLLEIKDSQLLGPVVKLNRDASISDVLQEIKDKNLADKIYG